MTTYQLFPRLTPDEYDALRTDISERGVLVPVEVDENNEILDGHHRVEIAHELGIEFPVVTRTGMTEPEKLEHVFALNIARRHLSGHDRVGVIQLCRQRGMSLRAIAKTVGVSHPTVMRTLTGGDGTDVPPDHDHAEPEPEPEPLPEVPTRTQRVQELRSEGLTQRQIAEQLGIGQATVNAAMNARVDSADAPATWPETRRLLASVKDLPNTLPEPRMFAASVPVRNRASAARQLRAVGEFLGRIAVELERSSR